MKRQSRADAFFEVSLRKSSFRTEILAGLTTFITMAYILVLNPQIMSEPYVIMGDPVMAQKISNGAFIGTCLGAFIGTMLCAVYARVPYVQAPGMGLNAFFAYTVVLAMGYSYNQALVVVFLSGVFFIIITKFGLREAIVNAIPDSVKLAITPGVGLFITILGLKNGGLVVGNPSTLVSLVQFSQWKDGGDSQAVIGALLTLVGLVIIGVLSAKKVKGAVIISIFAVTLLGIPFGVTQVSKFDLNLAGKFADFFEVSFFRLDFAGLFAGESFGQDLLNVLLLVISFSLVNMFDSIGTLLGAAKQSNLVDEEGNVVRMKEAMMSDAISTAAGALMGTSTVTTVVEGSAGIAAGGRTGMTSLTTAIMFLIAIIFAPVVGMIPSVATAPALIYVGVLMLSNIKDVDFEDITNAIPAFCAIVFMPFTYSIANGVAVGLILHCVMKALSGKMKEIKPLTLIVALIFVVRYAFVSM